MRIATILRRRKNIEVDTPTRWAKKGYVAKPGHNGESMYTNGYCEKSAIFLLADDVVLDEEAAAAFLDQQRAARNAKRRQERRWKKECAKKRAEEARFYDIQCKKAWRKLRGKRIVVFDCETTGLVSASNDMLSLSYQLFVLKSNRDCSLYARKQMISKDYFFDWPDDASRVTDRAIEVNGLTRERLAELGTSDMREAIADFAEVLRGASLAVAHNASFDVSFVMAAATKYGIEIPWPIVFCTMTSMTDWCKVVPYYDKWKWPKLCELAWCLGVNDADISYHSSGADVELTARCLMQIASQGLAFPSE